MPSIPDIVPAVAAPAAGPTLTVVIPALDEEQAIGDTVARCRAAVAEIRAAAGLADVEIIVVSDGSTDRTAEIARSFDDVHVIEFEHNRGYGAAIKEGFRQGCGELLGFLDADGTCDPRTFATLCRRLIDDDAHIVLGSRLGPDSRMPAVRRLGNRIFALLLSLLCGRRVTDTASGMRVLRRDAFDALRPLPDGLHFTPSMSARALLDDMRVIEVPMRYEERVGESKLSVGSDGVRFLKTIVGGVLSYRPERLFLAGFLACLLVGAWLAAYPLEFYLRNGFVQEWMLYRFLVCFLLGSVGYQLLGGAALAHRMRALGPRRSAAETFWSAAPPRAFQGWPLIVFTTAVVASSILLLWPGIAEFATSRQLTLHWSRFVTGIFGLVVAGQALITGVLLRVLALWQTHRAARGAIATDDPVAVPRLRLRRAITSSAAAL